MTALLAYLFVAAYFVGEFNGADNARFRLTAGGIAFNAFAAMLWPLGVA